LRNISFLPNISNKQNAVKDKWRYCVLMHTVLPLSENVLSSEKLVNYLIWN